MNPSFSSVSWGKPNDGTKHCNALRQDVDLEYIVLPSRVKENIILQSPQDISGYMVTVYTENLSAENVKNSGSGF